MALRRRQHLPHRRRHAGEDVARGRHQHAGAGAVGEFHQPGLLQRNQRLADRRAADAEGDLQVPLRRQLISGAQLAGEDLGLQMRGDVLEEFLAFYDEWVDHRPFIPSCLTTMQ